MPPTTINTPLIADATLAAQWRQLTSSITKAPAQDIDGALHRIATAREASLEPVLGVFAQHLVDGRLSQPTSLSELLSGFMQFITQAISSYEERAEDLEQRFIDSFRQHRLMALTPRSFRQGSRHMTDETLASAINLVTELNAERIVMEREMMKLEHAFKDPDERIIIARDRVHKVSNQLTAIQGYAGELQRRNLNTGSQREYLTAIQTMIRKLAEMHQATPEDNPIELFRRMNPRVDVKMLGSTPTFLESYHPKDIVTALEHLSRNAYEAGATEVRIKAEFQPSDPIFAIAVEDNGPGMPESLRQQLLDGQAGSGWKILRKVTFKRLSASYDIQSPFQNAPQPHGTLVMLFIPVTAKTGDEPDRGRTRKADTGPIPARQAIPTPERELPAIPKQKPASMAVGLAPSVAGAAAVYAEQPVGVVLKFERLR